MRYFRLHVIELDNIGRAVNNGAILDVIDCDDSDFSESQEISRFLSRAIHDSMKRILEDCE